MTAPRYRRARSLARRAPTHEDFETLTPPPVDLPPEDVRTWSIEHTRFRVSEHGQILARYDVKLEALETRLASLEAKLADAAKIANAERNQWRRQLLGSAIAFAALVVGILTLTLNRC